MIGLSANLTEFNQQLRLIALASKREASQSLNKRHIQVLIGSKGHKGAVHLTKKTTRARIRKDMNKKFKGAKSIYIYAAKWLKRQGIGKGMTFEQWRGEVGRAALRIFEARDRSRAFLAAGWLNAVIDIGRVTNTSTNRSIQGVKVYPGGQAAKSFGIPATPKNLTVQTTNAAAGAPGSKSWTIANAGLQRGIAGQISDMKQYLQSKIEKAAKKHTDKA